MIHSVPTMVSKRIKKLEKAVVERRSTQTSSEHVEDEKKREDVAEEPGVTVGEILKEAVADAFESVSLWLRRSSHRDVPTGHSSGIEGTRVDFDERSGREEEKPSQPKRERRRSGNRGQARS